MSEYPQKLSLFNLPEIYELTQSLLSTIETIRIDYFSSLSEERFYLDYVFHESVVMKCVAMRFASSKVWKTLQDKVVDRTGYFDEYLLHPIFYARFSHRQWHCQNTAFLDSQPHYDRAFGVYAYSIWLALLEANESSGGLCFFHDAKEIEDAFYVDWHEKNRYNYDLYVERADKLDPIIQKNVIHPNLSLGQAYIFDSNTLHAATKPNSSNRLSFDFRFIPIKQLNCSAEAKTIIKNFNAEPDLSNALNLWVMGDWKGAELLSDKLGKYAGRVPQKYDITVPNQKFSWRDEYMWCKPPYSIGLHQ